MSKHLISESNKDTNVKIALLALISKSNKTAILTPSEPSKYLRLDSTTGSFLVVLEDIQPYMDGYKVALSIENPPLCTMMERDKEKPRRLKNFKVYRDQKQKKLYWHNNWHKIILVSPTLTKKGPAGQRGIKRDLGGWFTALCSISIVSPGRIFYPQIKRKSRLW